MAIVFDSKTTDSTCKRDKCDLSKVCLQLGKYSMNILTVKHVKDWIFFSNRLTRRIHKGNAEDICIVTRYLAMSHIWLYLGLEHSVPMGAD